MPAEEMKDQRHFDPELQAASLTCDCRKRKDYHCNLCQRAWNQAWDLAEGKITKP
jgi:hypothetical protein